MSEGRPPADFAMLRAVEILANIHERRRLEPNEPPKPLEQPVVLRSDRLTVEIVKTTRAAMERELGVAFSYPARGWHTYATKENGLRALLSLFYKDANLVAAELYVPRTERTPPLEPQIGGFSLEPGSIGIGTSADAVRDFFMPAIGGPANLVYDRAFEARFPGGVAYAMASKGTIERLALYADLRSAAT